MQSRVLVTIGGILLLSGGLLLPAHAQESAANPDLERLKAQLAAQQEQIDQLRKALEEQKKTIADATRPQPPSLGQVASTTPIVPVAEVSPVLHPGLAAALSPPQAGTDEPASPLQIRIGTATFTPIGFMDFTAVLRTSTVGSSIGTSFGGTPYINAANGLGKLSELRLSAQNSRIGGRFDANVHGTKVLAYWESDFLGTQATNAGVSTHSDSFRMRLYWVDLRHGNWEILGGQSWSMLTPGRKGISGLPADIFYSQDIDTNYQVGIPWTRAPQFRAIYHAGDVVTVGFALESAQQYGGGSSGGGAIVLPNAFNAAAANTFANTQIDLGAGTYTPPNLHPDVQAKLALDPTVGGKLMHVEFAGFFSSFKTNNPLTSTSFTKQGGGGEANFNLELVKNFRLIVNTFVSDGGGRYLFGQAPDLIVRPNGSPSPLHSASTTDGFEYTTHNTMFYAYYGGVYIGRDVAIDTANKNGLIGYGFTKSPNSQNRTIQEGTFGLNQTFWKNPNYGALNFMLQYSYLFRNPWYLAAGAPRNTHNNMIFLNLRYTLPGSAPSAKK